MYVTGKFNGLTVEIERHEGVPTMEQMQEAVGGGLFCWAYNILNSVNSPVATVWVNDEGLLFSGNHLLQHDYAGRRFAGDFIITGIADHEGETLPLEKNVANWISPDHFHLIGYTR